MVDSPVQGCAEILHFYAEDVHQLLSTDYADDAALKSQSARLSLTQLSFIKS